MKYFPNITSETLSEMCNGYSMDQLEQMYIGNNYTMELVSKVTAIDLPTLSRLLWDFGLPDKKMALMGNKTYEVKMIHENNYATPDAMEDAAFDEL